MDRNRQFAELAGLKWHEKKDKVTYGYAPCSCGKLFGRGVDLINHIYRENPDYSADPRLVLEVMRKRADWIEFCNSIGAAETPDYSVGLNGYQMVDIDLILDKTGKLLDAAIKWMEGRKGKIENFVCSECGTRFTGNEETIIYRTHTDSYGREDHWMQHCSPCRGLIQRQYKEARDAD